MSSTNYTKLQLTLISVLLLSMLVQGIVSIKNNSLTSDETLYIGAGKEIFETGNMSSVVVMAHPPLSYYIGSIFLIPLKFDKSIWEKYDDWERGQNVVFHSGHDSDTIIFLSRLPFVILSLLTAWYVLRWSTELYGSWSGITALFLYSFNPSIIAYSSITTTDFTVAAMFFISLYYFLKLVKEPSSKNLLLAGLFVGLSLLSKITSILLIPIFILFNLVFFTLKKYRISLRAIIKNLLVIMLISILMIFFFYIFQYDTLSNSLPSKYFKDKVRQELSSSQHFPDELVYIFDKVKIPVPSYLIEWGYLFYISLQPNPGYIFGKLTDNVPWYYVYITFLLKTSITIFILLFIAIALQKKLPGKNCINYTLLWLPVLLIFINFSFSNKISGVRHILAVYPLLFVISSNAINIKTKHKKLKIFFILSLLLYYGISTLSIAPHYTAYTSEFFGRAENAHNIVVGSNIDHGQDLYRLKEYLQKNNVKKIKLSYFGQADPKDYNISYEYLPSPNFLVWVPDYTNLRITKRNEDCSEKKGILAISITNLKNVYLINKTCFDWLKKYQPVDKAGYTIFIYNITK